LTEKLFAALDSQASEIPAKIFEYGFNDLLTLRDEYYHM